MLLFIDIDGDEEDEEEDEDEDEDGRSVTLNILAALLNIASRSEMGIEGFVTSELGTEGFVSLAFLRFRKPNFAIPADKLIQFLLKMTRIFAAA